MNYGHCYGPQKAHIGSHMVKKILIIMLLIFPSMGSAGPLHWAAYNDHDALVKVLLALGSNINERDQHGYTPLLLAAMMGNILTVQVLLAHRADINANNRNGDTAILLAAHHGHVFIVQVLLNAGADVTAGANINKANLFGNTALHMAAIRENSAVFLALLGAGANLAIANNHGHTALQVATPAFQETILRWQALAMPINVLLLRQTYLIAADLTLSRMERNALLQRSSGIANIGWVLKKLGLPWDVIYLILSFLKIKYVPVDVKKYKLPDPDKGGGPGGGGGSSLSLAGIHA